MSTYLLEIGTEELPAGHLTESESRLQQLIREALKEANLSFGELSTMSTPRRICLIINGLADKQETVSKKVKGPPLDKCFDANGNPTQAATGFADKNRIKVDELDREEIGGIKYIVANLTIPGKAAADVLAETMPKVISQLSGERPMRWGASDFKFSRPIRWLVSLLDDKVVPFTLDRLTAGRTTMGHRVLSPGSVEISSPAAYISLLKEKKVLVDPRERRHLIESQVSQLAKDLNGKARQLSGPLLEEVVYITEWPHAVVGDFASEYLDLPDALIETIMVHHQRYFPIEKADKKEADTKSVLSKSLLPHFITIANNDQPQAQATIKLGNERVLKARLADGRFFYFDDQKTKLSERKSALAQLTFQRGLGSYADKIERLLELTKLLTNSLKLEAKYSVPMERAVELCKLDLVTNLVRELPELQGFVGAWYAEQEQQPPEVVRAIASHYSPRSTDDAIPCDVVGQLTAVIDKVDNLVGLFALGNKPSGSSDPFALRRQAQGVIDILVDGLPAHAINVTELIDKTLQLLQPFCAQSKKGWSPEKIKADLGEFLLQRLKGKLHEMSVGRETVEAVISARDPLANLHDLIIRCRCIDRLVGPAGNIELVRSGVRIGKILSAESTVELDEKLLQLPAEKSLFQALTAAEAACKLWQVDHPNTEEEYEQLLKGLAPLSAPINDFFDNVMVNDEDARLKANRHALLRKMDRYFKKIADFPKLQTLLPT